MSERILEKWKIIKLLKENCLVVFFSIVVQSHKLSLSQSELREISLLWIWYTCRMIFRLSIFEVFWKGLRGNGECFCEETEDHGGGQSHSLSQNSEAQARSIPAAGAVSSSVNHCFINLLIIEWFIRGFFNLWFYSFWRVLFVKFESLCCYAIHDLQFLWNCFFRVCIVILELLICDGIDDVILKGYHWIL